MQVIPSACNLCEEKKYEVSNMCQGCIAHPCMEVCPKGAISQVDGKSVIDQEKCIKCGRCKAACPYDAISRKKDLVPWLVELEQLEQMNTEEQRLMQINVYPVVSVW